MQQVASRSLTPTDTASASASTPNQGPMQTSMPSSVGDLPSCPSEADRSAAESSAAGTARAAFFPPARTNGEAGLSDQFETGRDLELGLVSIPIHTTNSEGSNRTMYTPTPGTARFQGLIDGQLNTPSTAARALQAFRSITSSLSTARLNIIHLCKGGHTPPECMEGCVNNTHEICQGRLVLGCMLCSLMWEGPAVWLTAKTWNSLGPGANNTAVLPDARAHVHPPPDGDHRGSDSNGSDVGPRGVVLRQYASLMSMTANPSEARELRGDGGEEDSQEQADKVRSRDEEDAEVGVGVRRRRRQTAAS